MAWDLEAARHGAHFLDDALRAALGELWFFRSRELEGKARLDSLQRAWVVSEVNGVSKSLPMGGAHLDI